MENYYRLDYFDLQVSCWDDPNCCHNEIESIEIEDEYSVALNITNFTTLAQELLVNIENNRSAVTEESKEVKLYFVLPHPDYHTYLEQMS